MFIVTGKSHCCNDTFTDDWFHSCKQRVFKKNTNNLCCYNQHSLAIVPEKVTNLNENFKELRKKTKVAVFSEHSVCHVSKVFVYVLRVMTNYNAQPRRG